MLNPLSLTHEANLGLHESLNKLEYDSISYLSYIIAGEIAWPL
ncbi:hypothetical protein BDE27_0505 [Xenorhabdus ehlersii]|uniref:Uncharacterized protein n=1 Tax=Xenorhabdus ehlersii TaxID=290111 RepID=A0A2D0IQ82_9GAMM|nr:hypothetical protein [Xenorhabdus sp. TS4]PHM23984.1 hypothetical protein Xehl_02348 [Xenorhabdus ehlersii]RKE92842.1 hypothetical protein BDE27_0505 [Xenorhabdus ehlersii]